MCYAVTWYALCRGLVCAMPCRYALCRASWYVLCRGFVDRSGPTVDKPTLEQVPCLTHGRHF